MFEGRPAKVTAGAAAAADPAAVDPTPAAAAGAATNEG